MSGPSSGRTPVAEQKGKQKNLQDEKQPRATLSGDETRTKTVLLLLLLWNRVSHCTITRGAAPGVACRSLAGGAVAGRPGAGEPPGGRRPAGSSGWGRRGETWQVRCRDRTGEWWEIPALVLMPATAVVPNPGSGWEEGRWRRLGVRAPGDGHRQWGRPRRRAERAAAQRGGPAVRGGTAAEPLLPQVLVAVPGGPQGRAPKAPLPAVRARPQSATWQLQGVDSLLPDDRQQ